MKLQMCLVLGLALLLDICQAQFGPVQNCAGSSCNQNNFGRKRRQILEEILAEVEADEDAKVVKRQAQNCQGSDCTQNNLGPIAPGPGPVIVAPPPAPVVIVDPPPPAPVVIVDPPPPAPVVIVEPPPPSPVVIVEPPPPAPVVIVDPPPPAPVVIVEPPPLPGFPTTGFPFGGAGGAGGQVQNCQGSDCTQNNLGGPVAPGPAPVPAPGPVLVPAPPGPFFPAGFPFAGGSPFTPGFPFGGAGGFGASFGGAGGQVQNCQGSDCTQNNLGRKKREIAEAINALTRDVLEAEDEAVAEDAAESLSKSKRDADAQSQNCFGSSCNQNNFGRRKREVIAALLEELL